MRTFILGISVLYIVTSGDQFRIGIGNCYETLRIMESRHCPYLALPNMVSELMLDYISFSWLYCGSAMSEPIRRSSSQRKESEPIQFHKPSFWPSVRTTKSLCPVRRVYHDHFAWPIETRYVGPAEPNARADLSHTDI